MPLSGELTLMPLPKDLPAGEHTVKESAVAAAEGDLGGVRDNVITLKETERIVRHRNEQMWYDVVRSAHAHQRG